LVDFDFLFGLIIRDNVKCQNVYYPFFISNPNDQNNVKSIFINFIEILEEYQDSPVYHWHSYEKTNIIKYFSKFEIDSNNYTIDNRLIDIYKEFTNNWIFPVTSLSIKDIAKHLGYNWKQSNFDGRLAITKYLEFLKYKFRQEEIKQEIIEYNKDDIQALIHVFDWLNEN
jgi:predicted RecB family nuclease